jgi:hypothetical protein
MRVRIEHNHRLAEVIARITFPTKWETSRNYEDSITVIRHGEPIAWRVFNPDVPSNVRSLLFEKIISG